MEFTRTRRPNRGGLPRSSSRWAVVWLVRVKCLGKYVWVGDGLLDDLWWCGSFVFSVLFIGGFVCSSLTYCSLYLQRQVLHIAAALMVTEGRARDLEHPLYFIYRSISPVRRECHAFARYPCRHVALRKCPAKHLHLNEPKVFWVDKSTRRKSTLKYFSFDSVQHIFFAFIRKISGRKIMS
ncbi:unnamed protein product, partial [Ascophyllum nodosum]